MAVIKAFAAIRPHPGIACAVAAPPYDVLNSAEAREMVKGNPFSFLRVDKAEVDLDPSVSLYDEQVYAQAKKNLMALIKNDVLLQDDKPCLYIYRLTRENISQTGLVCCTSIDDYVNGVIKKHELTRSDKEQDRIRHIESTNANTGPIFLTYRADKTIQAMIDNRTEAQLYDFTAEDGVRHEVWILEDEDEIRRLENAFLSVPTLYIADGHHRNAAAVKVGLGRRAGNKDPNAAYNFTLSVIFPDHQLRILDYNRVVKDLNGLSKEEFLTETAKRFDVTPLASQEKPSRQHSFTFYLDHVWYLATLKNWKESPDPVENLDVALLQNFLLAPVLGIDDPRVNKRIDFVGGARGLAELTKRVDSGEMAVAFALYPTSIQELMAIADANQLMPPKSTWFEPKLRSGLFIHTL
jgi:uncharacterized protein (DUF1015 family)